MVKASCSCWSSFLKVFDEIEFGRDFKLWSRLWWMGCKQVKVEDEQLKTRKGPVNFFPPLAPFLFFRAFIYFHKRVDVALPCSPNFFFVLYFLSMFKVTKSLNINIFKKTMWGTNVYNKSHMFCFVRPLPFELSLVLVLVLVLPFE